MNAPPEPIGAGQGDVTELPAGATVFGALAGADRGCVRHSQPDALDLTRRRAEPRKPAGEFLEREADLFTGQTRTGATAHAGTEEAVRRATGSSCGRR